MFESFAKQLGFINRHSDAILAIAVMSILFLLMLPLNPSLLDLLISFSIFFSIVTLLVTLYSPEPLAFNAFPSFLLFLTLYRLGLNIASTRMILTEGHAGEIIKTFGEVVTGGNAFVGFLIFLLITGINFVVITKGSGRVAEVAARFTLDSLPGKQLAIDADVNAGLINEQEAKKRRDRVMAEADFYGAMDGASKFVRGDAIAGMVIILVNTVGGFIVGMVMKGMNWSEVVKVYITLTVGDGLVTQIPALLVSVGAGIIVTKTANKENLAESFRKQVFSNPKVLTITSCMLFVMGLIPGMPFLVMGPLAAVIMLYSYVVSKAQEEAISEEEVGSGITKGSRAGGLRRGEEVEKILFIDPMEVELGNGLDALVDNNPADNLVKRVSRIRREIASELGVVVPAIRIHDNPMLNYEMYSIKIKGDEVANGSLRLNSFLAMDTGAVTNKLSGIETVEPAFGLPALWIPASEKEFASESGYLVTDPLTVLSTHLIEIIRANAHDLLNRQEVAKLVENAREHAPAVIDELIPMKISLGQLLRVLQNLLRERISIRDIVSILEILADTAGTTKDVDVLSEYVRQGLSRSISKQYMTSDQSLYSITLDPKLEQVLIDSIQKTEMGKNIIVHPLTMDKILGETWSLMQIAFQQGIQPVFVTTATLRPYFRRLIERSLPGLPVLSMNEIVPEIRVFNLGVVTPEVLVQ